MKESDIQRAILDYLAARHVPALRMNTLAMPIADGKRFIKAGVPGMADILAFPRKPGFYSVLRPFPLWLEVKSASGKQSELQKSFQRQVESEGHWYGVVRSIEDVEELLNGL